jgi:hypothetical protein
LSQAEQLAAEVPVTRLRLAAKLPDEHCCLQEDSPGHLRTTGPTIWENDWHLYDPKSGPVAEMVYLDLKAITI